MAFHRGDAILKKPSETMSADFVITRATSTPLETVCQRLPEISAAHRFGVLGVHNLREKMESKGVAFGRECRVF